MTRRCWIYIYIYIHIRRPAGIYIYIYIYLFICIDSYIYIYIYSFFPVIHVTLGDLNIRNSFCALERSQVVTDCSEALALDLHQPTAWLGPWNPRQRVKHPPHGNVVGRSQFLFAWGGSSRCGLTP